MATAPSAPNAIDSREPTGLALADLDGDGALDLVVATPLAAAPSTITIFHNLGGGTFDAPIAIESPLAKFHVAVAESRRRWSA